MKKSGLRWLSFGLLWVLAAGCGGSDSPTTPTPVTPNFAGTWTGSGRLVQCTGNTAVCAGSSPGGSQPIEFVLAQTGTSVSGTWTVNAAEPRIAVTGLVASDGTLNLSGRHDPSSAAIDSSRLTVAGAAMNGTLNFSLTPPNQGPGTFMLELAGVTRR